MNSLFTYSSGSWSDYTNDAFVPIFFNPDLSIMFPDPAKRQQAQDLCYQRGGTDPKPEARRECYFDYKVTDNTEAGAATAGAKSKAEEQQKLLSMAK